MKVESNLSWVPENSKNITRHVGDQILKFLSPTDKNYSHLRVGEWLFATLVNYKDQLIAAYLQVCSSLVIKSWDWGLES